MKANIFHRAAVDASGIRDTDLTGAFQADITVGQAMSDIADRLTELAREEVERCSCDESLALRDRLAIAARGTYALHVVKEDGYWSVERWRDGEMVESYVGLETIADALDRIGEWMR